MLRIDDDELLRTNPDVKRIWFFDIPPDCLPVADPLGEDPNLIGREKYTAGLKRIGYYLHAVRECDCGHTRIELYRRTDDDTLPWMAVQQEGDVCGAFMIKNAEVAAAIVRHELDKELEQPAEERIQ